MEPADLAIECRDLVRIYATKDLEVQALQGLNLRVARGELTALVGASGSGKSTLLSILAGLDRPTAGTATVGGVLVNGLTGRDRVRFFRHTVGFVWQQTSRNLLPYLTAAQNVALPLAFARSRARRQRVDELLELMSVGDCRGLMPRDMSGGQQQRVAVAVALANEPDVLLADEPTGELDDDTTEDVLESIRDVNRELGVTTLIVTHDPLVSEHVRRSVQIRDGRTSSEVHTRTHVAADGTEQAVSERFAVIDTAGRLQLPAEFVDTLSLQDRVRLGLEEDHVTVSRGDER
ncbi:ABC-type lipoprotein export system, ATPase component [Paramicrobacterium humi]|uniref:ABC-type lipoprotein export system, ATPase component n=1 Tax=Paramicrobacterium humi TaxID=640635 RepID=A0A1H4MD18_9MICO|nr:ABC transporter ATP-binding protein [Microbacterium humi]SEB80916.1 ABC-type lipoprotein export system, ATPase component [Microbacterium humi]